jgi:hypothetical protein
VGPEELVFPSEKGLNNIKIRELEMSTTAQAADGGKQRLELLLLQREVEQQQQQNHYIRKSLNRMPEAPAQVVHHPVPASSGVLVSGLLSSFFLASFGC